jgi:hypothetical protein
MLVVVEDGGKKKKYEGNLVYFKKLLPGTYQAMQDSVSSCWDG